MEKPIKLIALRDKNSKELLLFMTIETFQKQDRLDRPIIQLLADYNTPASNCIATIEINDKSQLLNQCII